MCRHRYVPLDIVVLEDEKIESMRALKGESAFGIFCAILTKLAQHDKDDYSYPTDAKLLRHAIKSTAPLKLIRWVVEESGLFELDAETGRFYSPRLRKHFRELDVKRYESYQVPEDVTTEGNASDSAPTAPRPKRQLSEEARAQRREAAKARWKREDASNAELTRNDAELMRNDAEPMRNDAEPNAEPNAKLMRNDAEWGDYRGAKRPLKIKEEVKEESYSPLSPPGGGMEAQGAKADLSDGAIAQRMGERDKELAKLQDIPDPTTRELARALLLPPLGSLTYARTFLQLYTEATHGNPAFAPAPDKPSALMKQDALTLWQWLLPEDVYLDGVTRPKQAPSVSEVLTIIQRIRDVFHSASASDTFGKFPAMANAPWLLKVDNFSKTEQGNYRNTPRQAPSAPAPQASGARGMVNQFWEKVNEERRAKPVSPETQARIDRLNAINV